MDCDQTSRLATTLLAPSSLYTLVNSQPIPHSQVGFGVNTPGFASRSTPRMHSNNNCTKCMVIIIVQESELSPESCWGRGIARRRRGELLGRVSGMEIAPHGLSSS